MAKTTEISFHGETGHAAIDVKVRLSPIGTLNEATRECIYEECVGMFWELAQNVAHENGYSGVFSEGRSGGWCVPYYQYANGILQQFSNWPGQGPQWGYPSYPEMTEKEERTRFVKFRNEILASMKLCEEVYCKKIGA